MSFSESALTVLTMDPGFKKMRNKGILIVFYYIYVEHIRIYNLVYNPSLMFTIFSVHTILY